MNIPPSTFTSSQSSESEQRSIEADDPSPSPACSSDSQPSVSSGANSPRNPPVLGWTLNKTLEWLRNQSWIGIDLPFIEGLIEEHEFTADKFLSQSLAEIQDNLGISQSNHLVTALLQNIRHHLSSIAYSSKQSGSPHFFHEGVTVSSSPKQSKKKTTGKKGRSGFIFSIIYPQKGELSRQHSNRSSTVSRQLVSQLINSVDSSSIHAIKKFLSRYDIDINVQDQNGWGLLHAAAHTGRLDLYLELLKLKIDVNLTTIDGSTALHYLVRLPASEMLTRCLTATLRRVEDINQLNYKEESPLHFAVLKVNIAALNLLLEYGADPNIANQRGDTSLHFAVHVGNPIVIQRLLEYSADPLLLNKQNQSPLSLAHNSGSRSIALILENRQSLPANSPPSESLPSTHSGHSSSDSDKQLDTHTTQSLATSKPRKTSKSSSHSSDSSSSRSSPKQPAAEPLLDAISFLRATNPAPRSSPKKPAEPLLDAMSFLREANQKATASSTNVSLPRQRSTKEPLVDAMSFLREVEPPIVSSASHQPPAKEPLVDAMNFLRELNHQPVEPYSSQTSARKSRKSRSSATNLSNASSHVKSKASRRNLKDVAFGAVYDFFLKAEQPSIVQGGSFVSQHHQISSKSSAAVISSLPGPDRPSSPDLNPTIDTSTVSSESSGSISEHSASMSTNATSGDRSSESQASAGQLPTTTVNTPLLLHWDHSKTLSWMGTQAWIGERLPAIQQAISQQHLVVDQLFAGSLADIQRLLHLPADSPIPQALKLRLHREWKVANLATRPKYEQGPIFASLSNPPLQTTTATPPAVYVPPLQLPLSAPCNLQPSGASKTLASPGSDPCVRDANELANSVSSLSQLSPTGLDPSERFGWNVTQTLNWVNDQSWLGTDLSTIQRVIQQHQRTADWILDTSIPMLLQEFGFSSEMNAKIQALRQRLLRELKLRRQAKHAELRRATSPESRVSPAQTLEPASIRRATSPEPHSQQVPTGPSVDRNVHIKSPSRQEGQGKIISSRPKVISSSSLSKISRKNTLSPPRASKKTQNRQSLSIAAAATRPRGYSLHLSNNRTIEGVIRDHHQRPVHTIISLRDTWKANRHLSSLASALTDAFSSSDPQLSRILSLQVPCHGLLQFAGTRLTATNPTSALLSEIGKNGNFNAFVRLLSTGKILSIDIGLHKGQTFLHLVALSHTLSAAERVACIQSCLRLGAAIDLRNAHLETPLHLFGRLGCLASFHLLASNGADQFARTEEGKFPLQLLLQQLNHPLNAEDLALLISIIKLPHSAMILNSLHLDALVGSDLSELIREHSTASLPHVAQLLLRAAVAGDVETIRTLVQQDHNLPRTRTPIGMNIGFLAIMYGHLQVIKFLEEHYNDLLFSRLRDGSNLLHFAILHQQLEISHYLIQHYPALINEECCAGYTALHVAAFRGDLIEVSLLLSSTQTRSSNPQILSPLFLACLSGSLPIIEQLVAAGYPIEFSELIGFTPAGLFAFSQTKSVPEIEHLLALANDLDSRSALLTKKNAHLSLSNWHLTDHLCSLLLRRVSMLPSDVAGNISSLSLKSNRLTQIPLELLRFSALNKVKLDKNFFNAELERTLLSKDYLLVIKPYLVALQRTHRERDWNLMAQMAFHGFWSMFVGQSPGDVNAYLRHVNPLGESFLHILLKNQNLSTTVRLQFMTELLAGGIDPDCQTLMTHETALHFAARLGCLASIRLLLENAANCLLQNFEGETFLHILTSCHQYISLDTIMSIVPSQLREALLHTPTRVNQLLIQESVPLTPRSLPVAPTDRSEGPTISMDAASVLLSSCELGRESLFCRFISTVDASLLFDLRDIQGNSLLHIATRRGHLNIVTALLNRLSSDSARLKEYINLRRAVPSKTFSESSSSSQVAALHLAAELGHLKIVELLISYTAEVNDPLMPFRLTPLMLACLQPQLSSSEIVTYLLAHGSDPTARTISGNTALHYAVASASYQKVTALLTTDMELITVRNDLGYTPFDLIDHLLAKDSSPEIERIFSLCKVAFDFALDLSVQPVSKSIPSLSLAHAGLIDAEMDTILQSLTRFPSLKSLDLRHNQLSRIPAALLSLPNLKTVFLSGNPLISCSFESHLLSSTTDYQKISRYIKDCQKNVVGGQKLLKIAICGQEAVGKTSLSRCLVNHNQTGLHPKDREHLLSTDGLAISSLTIHDTAVTLWDFAGQTIYESIQQLLLSQNVFYLLLWDIRKSCAESAIDRWCQLIRVQSERCRVLIVGTHIDMVPDFDAIKFFQQITELRARYPFIWGCEFVSTVSGTGLAELNKKLVDFIKSSALPKSTLCQAILLDYIDAQLSTGCYPIVSFDSLYHDLSRWTIFALSADPRGLLFTSLQRLHQVGKIFYLAHNRLNLDDPNAPSSDSICLDPQWLVNIMISVVTTKLVASKGFISHQTLQQMLPRRTSRENREELIRLLCSFGCLLPVASQKPLAEKPVLPHALANPQKFLVPALLPLEKTEMIDKWEKSRPDHQYFLPHFISYLPKDRLQWTFERWCLFTLTPPIFPNLLAAISHWGTLESAWKRGALFSKVCQPFVNTQEPDALLNLEHTLYIEEFDLIDAVNQLPVRGLRFSFRILISDPPTTCLNLGAKFLRKLTSLTQSILANVYPSIAAPTWVIPCPQCKDATSSLINHRHLFDLDTCLNALSHGKLSLQCPKCLLIEASPATLYPTGMNSDMTSLPLLGLATFSTMYLVPDFALCDLAHILYQPQIHFETGDLIGKGGFGRVFSGQLLGNTKCALKMLDTPDSFTEMVRECLYFDSCRSPYIVSLLGVTLQPVPGLLLEYVGGGDLFRYAHDPWRFLARIKSLFQESSTSLLMRDHARLQPDFNAEEWSFERRFAEPLHELSAIVLPQEASTLLTWVPHIVTATRDFWNNPVFSVASARDSIIEQARLAHLTLLQLPALSISSLHILQIGLDLARALHHMHSLTPPIVHLDVKTPNVLLVSADLASILPGQPLVKLTDFGTATEYTPSLSSKLSSCKHLDINPKWSAPEVHAKSFHPKSDIWSWGLLVWELYTREVPFEGVDPATSHLEEAIRDGLRPLNSHLMPSPLRIFLERCWLVNPEDRPSAEDVIQFMERLIRDIEARSNIVSSK